MFAASYFAGSYFPASYFSPGGMPTPPPGVVLKYFPGPYFAPSYFTGYYFPGGSATIVSPFPVDLTDAIGNFVESSIALQGAGLTGVWADQKPRGQPNPALVIKIPDGSKFTSDADTLWYRVSPSLIVLAATKQQAASLGAIIEREFKNQAFVYGEDGSIRTDQLRVKNIRRAKDQADTMGNEKVFRYVIEFECFEFRPRY